MKRLRTWAAPALLIGALAVVGCERGAADLLEGQSWQYSIDGGKTFADAPPVIPAKQQVAIEARAAFDVADPAGIAELELAYELSSWVDVAMTLNGTPIQRPVPEMGYRAFRGIDGGLLKAGPNTLTISYGVINGHDDDRPLPPIRAALNALTSDDLAFQTGPILGFFDADHFTVTCRTTMLADVTLHARPAAQDEDDHPIVVTGPRGLMHRFNVERREGYVFRLTAVNGAVRRATEWMPVPSWDDTTDGTLRFVVAGDMRTHPERWGPVAGAIRAEQPQFLVVVGDMVSAGRNDWEWDTEHFGPARQLVSTVPYYPVIGNHEQEAPVMRELFYTSSPDGRGWNWAQQIGDVLLIGIVGHWPFSPDTDNHVWLAETLAESDAKFVFLFSHYPAWSSRRTGAVNEAGEPYDKVTYQGQTVLMPLLAEHDGTAFIAGHDHFYERSEPPGGVSAVITGGGGARVYGKREDAAQINPYSKVFAAELHYCVFEVAGDTCTMTVRTPDGRTIDTRTWQARP